jgi:two-component system sensor histidine kinase UhpB
MKTLRLTFARLSLHTRLSLILTALIASLLLALGGLWLKDTHNSINEEIEAASRVAGQGLSALARPLRTAPSAAAEAQLLGDIEAIGRIRANVLEVLDAGQRRYLSPPSTYKAGRQAPGWFTALVEPRFAPLEIDAGALTLRLTPDPSRATLDAWDELCAMTGWALGLLLLLFLGTRSALDRALRPLEQLMAALDNTGPGRLDTRLPVYADPQLGRLSRAFNGMAARLAEAVHHNLQLEDDRELSEQRHRQLQEQLEAQRQAIARELHDELAQGITAVRALAGAIAQRTGEQPALHGHAQSIVAVAGQMQDGVRHILHRLRPPAQGEATVPPLATLLEQHLANWRQQQPQIAVHSELDLGTLPLGGETTLAALRIVQEGLTNIAKHAAASAVHLTIHLAASPAGSHASWRLQLCLSDNGRGLGQARDPATGCGLGLLGMRERAALLGGQLQLDNLPAGGARLQVWLPAQAAITDKESA